jgi:hypothetical protein
MQFGSVVKVSSGTVSVSLPGVLSVDLFVSTATDESEPESRFFGNELGAASPQLNSQMQQQSKNINLWGVCDVMVNDYNVRTSLVPESCENNSGGSG